MACKETQYQLDDRTYVIRQLPAVEAVKVEVFLAKTVGEAFLSAVATGDTDKSFAAAVGILAQKLDEAQLIDVMSRVFCYVGIKGKNLRICEQGDGGAGLNEHFAGMNRELWQVFLKALAHNFADFFGGSLSLSGLLKKATGSNGSNPPTSTGASGESA